MRQTSSRWSGPAASSVASASPGLRGGAVGSGKGCRVETPPAEAETASIPDPGLRTEAPSPYPLSGEKFLCKSRHTWKGAEGSPVRTLAKVVYRRHTSNTQTLTAPTPGAQVVEGRPAKLKVTGCTPLPSPPHSGPRLGAGLVPVGPGPEATPDVLKPEKGRLDSKNTALFSPWAVNCSQGLVVVCLSLGLKGPDASTCPQVVIFTRAPGGGLSPRSQNGPYL